MNTMMTKSHVFPADSTLSLEMTVAEYFAGIGLFRMGLEMEGWKVVYANDWSNQRAQMYKGFFSERYEVKDIFSVSERDVPPTTLATCSFPCVDLSLAGKVDGINGKHSRAFWGFYDLLEKQGEHAPPIVLLENVNGWLYSNQGEDFYITAKSLNQLGYKCDVFSLNARSFVPQSRPRIFMVAFKSLSECRDSAFFLNRSKLLMPKRLEYLIMRYGDDINWGPLNMPEPPAYRNSGFSDSVVEKIPLDDPRWWPEDKVDKHIAMMSPAHRARVLSMSQCSQTRFRTFFRRRRKDGQRAEVRSDDIAGCLRTAVGGSGKQFLVAAGSDSIRMRTLTVREYARLQGVSDEFPIVANTERQSLNAFGDAVCVPAVSWIARNVLNPLFEEIKPQESYALSPRSALIRSSSASNSVGFDTSDMTAMNSPMSDTYDRSSRICSPAGLMDAGLSP